MINCLRLSLLATALTSCTTLQPNITDTQDPFTHQRTRTMWVGPSNSVQLLDAMFPPPPLKPTMTEILTSNQFVSLNIEEGDTTLRVVRFAPERAFDIPASSLLQLKFYAKNNNGFIFNLPMLKAYHTTGGALIAEAKVDANAMRMLQRERLEIIRIEQVSTNESELKPVDWYPAKLYGDAFQKGAIKIFEPLRSQRYQEPVEVERPVKPAKPKSSSVLKRKKA